MVFLTSMQLLTDLLLGWLGLQQLAPLASAVRLFITFMIRLIQDAVPVHLLLSTFAFADFRFMVRFRRL